MANRNTLNCKHQRVEFVIYRALGHRDIQSTCQDCGMEWTVTEEVEDLADTITANEIIEVHEQLETGKSLKELVE